ncbi:hypothetical protein [Dictyobacter arantiisoli]|uniref:hypothetical protein n=1 Tax=Dictyobacter arantiisoli TaxID=2014874 RepID=UPI0011EDCAE2|nr:hypothetical protein [Dictyobacter arantiisoli]
MIFAILAHEFSHQWCSNHFLLYVAVMCYAHLQQHTIKRAQARTRQPAREQQDPAGIGGLTLS